MSSYLSTYTGLLLIDSRNNAGTIALPEASTVEGRAVLLKDAYGSFGLSTVTVSTTGADDFETGSNLFIMNQPNAYATFLASSNTWFRVDSASNSHCSIDTLGTSSIQASSITAYTVTVTGPSTLTVQGRAVLSTATTSQVSRISTIQFGNSLTDILSVSSGSLLINGSIYSGAGGGGNTSNFSSLTTSTVSFWTTIPSSNLTEPIFRQYEFTNRVRYLNGQFVTVGSVNGAATTTAAFSDDGYNWTPRDIGMTTMYDIDYNGSNLYIATGSDFFNTNIFTTSSDGSNWTPQAAPPQYDFTTGLAIKHVSSMNLWIAGGLTASTNGILTSPDGSNWTARSTSMGSVRTIAEHDGTILIGGFAGGRYDGTIQSSSNGIDWIEQQTALADVNNIHWLNNRWVAVGSPGVIQTMTDVGGSNWSTIGNVPTPGGLQYFDIAYGNSTWVATAGTTYSIYSSPDPFGSWTARLGNPELRYCYSAVFAESNFVAVGDLITSTSIVVSSNGAQWDTTRIVSTIPSFQSTALVYVDGTSNILLNGERFGITADNMFSTMDGLGQPAYIIPYTYGTEVRSFVSTATLSNEINANIISLSIQPAMAALGDSNYLTQGLFQSTNTGLTQLVTSTLEGLGTVGYISTASLTSTTNSFNETIQTSPEIFFTMWSSYSVEWTANTTNPSLGNGGLQGFFHQQGKQVSFLVDLTIGTTTTTGTGNWNFTLPVHAISSYSVIGHSMMYDNTASGFYQGAAVSRFNGGSISTVVIMWNKGTQANQIVDATRPFTWASNDQLTISGEYEAF